MKRFTKPILTLVFLAALTTAGILAMLKSRQTSEKPDASLIETETTATSKSVLSTEPKEQNEQTGSAPANPSVLPSKIYAAVLSNDTEATSLKKAKPVTDSTALQRPLPLIDSPTAAKWLETDGITRADIQTAQTRMKDSGFTERMLEDPSLVRQYLPRRNVQAAHVRSFTIAEKARSGDPIPFTVGGALPDSSFQFTHFDISQSSNVIRILPIGNTSGDTAPGEEIPVDLNGELGPLSPGIYSIQFPELGPNGSYQLIVE